MWEKYIVTETIQFNILDFVGGCCKFMNLNCLYSMLCTGSHLLFESLAKVNNERVIPITLIN